MLLARTRFPVVLYMAVACCVANAQQDTTAAADSLLLELQKELAQAQPAPAAARTMPSINPDMSVIGDLRASYNSLARRHFDAEFHEAEVAISSVVDPYARADFFLSVGRDAATGNFGLDLEEAFLTTLDLPAGLQIKAGKFRHAFGKVNIVHPHALPFIDGPNVSVNYLGDEGLNDEGVSVNWLVPNPYEFYQELTFELTRGPMDNPSFVRSDVDRFLYVGHLKNFWDLTDNATLELGLSGAAGPNDSMFTSILGGVDLTYKWKPLQFNAYQSFVVQAEALLSKKRISTDNIITTWGMYALATVQLNKRLFLTGRFDYSNLPDDGSFVERAYSATLGWLATEFQKVELVLKATTSNSFPVMNQVIIRSVFVIGAHGAHTY